MKASVILGLAIAVFPSSFAIAGAYSGQGVASKSQPAMTNPAGSNMLLPGQILASNGMVGLPVYDPSSERVGTVEAVVLDSHSSDVAAVVIGVRAFLGLNDKEVAVRMSDLLAGADGVTVNYTKRQLQRTVAYRTSFAPSH